MSRIRVAMGTVYPYDETRVRGGVEAAAFALVQALGERDDIELHVVSCHHNVRRAYIERRGSVTFHWLRTGPRLHALRAATTEAWRVRAVYQRIAPHLIHAQDYSAYALGAIAGVPLVVTVHGVEVLSPSMQNMAMYRGIAGRYRRYVTAWATNQSVKRATAVISVAGDYVARALGPLLPSDTPVHQIANPVAEAFFSVPDLPQDIEPVILCPAEIYELKNQIALVRALAFVKKAIPHARLVLAGGIRESHYNIRLIEEIERLGLNDHVMLPGRLDLQAILSAYADAAVVALASVQETAPMALAQALAAGRPVVAMRVGGIGSLVRSGATGFLVDSFDDTALAQNLVKLLVDPLLCNMFGRTGRAIARDRLAAGRVAEQTIDVYKRYGNGSLVGCR